MGGANGVANFIGGLGQGVAAGQQQALKQQQLEMQKEVNAAQLKQLKAAMDLEEKKQAYFAAHPEYQEIQMGVKKPESQADLMKAKLYEWAMGGGEQPSAAQTAAPQAQGPKFGASFQQSKLPAPGNQQLFDQATYWAQNYGVDPQVFANLVAAESSWNPNAVSPKGAAGLTQLMPGTAAEVGVANPHDPNENLRGGAQYLAQLLQQFGGDYEKAVAAYNAGPGAVKKYGGVPPYKETQGYVQKVLGLPDQIASAQVQQVQGRGGLTPEMVRRGVMKKELGVDFGEWKPRTVAGPGGAPVTVMHNPVTNQWDMSTPVAEPVKGEWRKRKLEDGSEIEELYSPYSGLNIQQPFAGAKGDFQPTGIRVSPAPKEIPPPIPDKLNEYIASEVDPILEDLKVLKSIAARNPTVLGAKAKATYEVSRMPVLGGVTQIDPDVNEFYQTLDRVRRSELKTYAGSAMSVQEMKRTLAAMPSTMSSIDGFMGSIDAIDNSIGRYKKAVYGHYSKSDLERAKEAQEQPGQSNRVQPMVRKKYNFATGRLE